MSRATGFTTIELVVTIVVIGIIGVVIMPRMDLIGGFDQSGFRDQLHSSLEYARKAAIAARRYVCVRITATPATVAFSINTSEPDGLTGPVCTGGNVVALLMPGGASSINAPTGVALNPSATTIAFDALGRSVDQTTLAVTNTTVGVGTTPVLNIEGETGLVH